MIDLPITTTSTADHAESTPESDSIIRYVLDRGAHMLKPRLTLHKGPRHMVLTGAPGNGKTTVAKFLVQIYRGASLNGGTDLSVDHQQIIKGTTNAMERTGRQLPQHRRWAMRVDLAEYAEEYGSSEDATIISYIAAKVSQRSDLGRITAAALAWWMQQWPWFLVLDGLDGVTEPTVRKRVINRVTEFVTTAEADNCDVFVVLTTRPMGYVENIAPTQFERVDLNDLPRRGRPLRGIGHPCPVAQRPRPHQQGYPATGTRRQGRRAEAAAPHTTSGADHDDHRGLGRPLRS